MPFKPQLDWDMLCEEAEGGPEVVAWLDALRPTEHTSYMPGQVDGAIKEQRRAAKRGQFRTRRPENRQAGI
jgi:hypothetical protein